MVPRRLTLARAIGLVAAISVGLASCGTDAVGRSSASSEATVASISTTTTSAAPPSTSSTTSRTEPLLEDISEGAWVATATGSGVSSFAAPGDEAATWFFPSPTQFGGERVFLVVAEQDEYLQVQLPVRPNESTGWIRRDEVVLSEVTTRAKVDLTTNSLKVWDGSEVIVETNAAVGKPSTPTPLGTFYVRDIIEKWPGSAYGSFILGLSGYSEVLETFGGGEPAIAIHGTNRPGLIGQEVSNGCIRIPNDLVELLAETLPLGTPVEIVG